MRDDELRQSRDLGTPLPEIDVFCDHCGRFLISFGRRSLFILVFSVLIAVVLFRSTHAIWPTYLLVAAGIVHLYAVAFSRGAALTRAAFLFAVIVGLWAVWVLGQWLSTMPQMRDVGIVLLLQELRERIASHLDLLPLPLWLFGTLWGIALGRATALPGVRLASSYFLGVGAFLFGLWGVWGLLLEYRLVLDWVFQATVVLALVAPLLVLIILLAQHPPEGPPEGHWAYVAALWLAIITIYLLGARLLITLVEFGLGTFLPRLLGHPPMPEITVPWLLRVLTWTAPVSTLLTAVVVIAIITSSAVQAAAGFEARKPGFYIRGMERAQSGLAHPGPDLGRIGANITGVVLEVIYLVYTVSRFVVRIVITLLQNLYRLLKQLPIYLWRLVRFLIVPVLVFSLLSFVTILLLRDYRAYTFGRSVLDARALWGEGITLMILVLVLCGASFGFARSVPGRFVADGTEAAVLGLIFYLLVSVASVALVLAWVGLSTAGFPFRAAEPGPLYVTNIAAVIILVLAMVALQMLVSFRTWAATSDQQDPVAAQESTVTSPGAIEAIVVVPVVLFAVIAIVAGFGPIKDGLAGALTP